MIYEILSGALMMSCLVTGLFFLKFWKKTRDKLFLIFAFAFFTLSLERLVLGYIGRGNEPSPQVYLFRLGAFILILIAIINKNRESNNQ
jgi:Family of unknown function (DUF5985)